MFNEKNATKISHEVIDIAPDAKKGIVKALGSVGIDENTVYPESSSIASKLKNHFSA